jgi:hypothetical protein
VPPRRGHGPGGSAPQVPYLSATPSPVAGTLDGGRLLRASHPHRAHAGDPRYPRSSERWRRRLGNSVAIVSAIVSPGTSFHRKATTLTEGLSLPR